jgi:hypothetical protein
MVQLRTLLGLYINDSSLQHGVFYVDDFLGMIPVLFGLDKFGYSLL